MATPCRCIICNGKGQVAPGFYPDNPTWTPVPRLPRHGRHLGARRRPTSEARAAERSLRARVAGRPEADMNLLPFLLVTLWAIMLMFVGIVILRLVSKVRVDILLNDHDMILLNAGEEIAVTTQSVVTKLRYKVR